MRTKSRRFDFDLEWWIVPKRLVYIVVAVIALSVLAGGAGVYVWLHGNPFKNVGADSSLITGARFDAFEGDVRVVRASTRETVTVRSDTRLLPGDIVQTQADGRARISLVDGSTLVVRPNSVVTIADNASAEDGKRTNVRVAVDRGQINVRTEQQTTGTNVVETPLTKNKLVAQTAASFNVQDDQTEEIRVNTGAVETTNTRSNEKTTVAANEYVQVKLDNFQRERLLEIPAPASPRNLEKIQAPGGGAAQVTLRWQRPASGAPAHYRVEVATSPFFVAAGKVFERDQLAATELTAGSLRPGNYYWRVRAVATSAQASDWSEPQKFSVVTGEASGESVSLTELSIEYVAGEIYIARGRTQPGNTVLVAGRATPAAADGTFKLQFSAPFGTREITVEAEGSQGSRKPYRVPLTPGAKQLKQ